MEHQMKNSLRALLFLLFAVTAMHCGPRLDGYWGAFDQPDSMYGVFRFSGERMYTGDEVCVFSGSVEAFTRRCPDGSEFHYRLSEISDGYFLYRCRLPEGTEIDLALRPLRFREIWALWQEDQLP